MAEIKVGDVVRSHDFPERKEANCYVEGVVEGIGYFPEEGFTDCPRYKVKPTKRVWTGGVDAETPPDFYVYPPVNGTPKLFGGVCDGVELVSE